MPIRHPRATWPGVVSPVSCTYTLSHGITPGVAMLKILPQERSFAEVGSLVITDNFGTITLPDCRVDWGMVELDDSGRVLTLAILDRRWKWLFGQLSGRYNQLDSAAKLIPWTIRSPQELAVLCLQAMGETRYEIDLPPGLTRQDGTNHGQANPDWLGVTQRTGTNPPISWVQEPPAQALANLCEIYGRRVVYQLGRNGVDKVLIVRQGVGGSLPDGSIANESQTINPPETPSGVAVAGSPTRYQAKFWLEAVGEEWNGAIVPLAELSYAPRTAGAVQISRLKVAGSGNFSFSVFINAPADADLDQGIEFTQARIGAANTHDAISAMAVAINSSIDPQIQTVVRAEASGDTLTVTGRVPGQAFSFWAIWGGEDLTDAESTLVQVARLPTADWTNSPPPTFANVRATERLTVEESRRLAAGSVYKMYRLTLTAPTGRGPLRIPAYPGELVRKQQIILLPTKVEQIQPTALEPNVVDPNLPEAAAPANGQAAQAAIRIDHYNGFSRDMPAAMYGKHALEVARQAHIFVTRNTGPTANTPNDARIFIPFSIDPEWQLVTFTSPVYSWRGSRVYPIQRPVLETSVHILNSETNSPECSYLAEPLPGAPSPTRYAVRTYEDIQLELIGQYGADGSTNGARTADGDTVFERAQYYLDGIKTNYLSVQALTRTYNGIVPIDCDGAIHQVTWQVGPGDAGGSTTASLGTEHSLCVPPYPARRRAEFLSAPRLARQQAREQNQRAGLTDTGQ